MSYGKHNISCPYASFAKPEINEDAGISPWSRRIFIRLEQMPFSGVLFIIPMIKYDSGMDWVIEYKNNCISAGSLHQIDSSQESTNMCSFHQICVRMFYFTSSEAVGLNVTLFDLI